MKKKRFTLLFFCFYFLGYTVNYAQELENSTWIQLKEKGIAAYNNDNYKLASTYLIKAEEKAEVANVKDNFDRFNILEHLLISLYYSDQIATFEKYLNKTFVFVNDNYGKESEFYYKCLKYQSWLFTLKYNFLSAEANMKKVLNFYDQNIDLQDPPYFAQMIENMASIQYYLDNYEQTIFYSKRALKIYKSINTDLSWYSNLYENLGISYLNLGFLDNYESMILEFKEEITNTKDTSFKTKWTFLKIEKEYQDYLGNIAGVEQKLNERLSLCKKDTTTPISSYSSLYFELILFHQNESNFEKALYYIKKQREYDEKNKPVDYLVRVQNLNSTEAEVLMDLGDYPKAEAILKETIEQFKRDGIGGLRLESGLYNNLAIIYASQKRNKEALPYYKMALEIDEKLNSSSKFPLASKSNLAFCLAELKKYDEALILFKELTRKINLNSLPIYKYTGIYNNLAILYSDIGRYKESVALYKKILDEVKKNRGKNEEYLLYLNNLGSIYGHAKDYDNAAKCYIEANNLLTNQIEQIFEFRSEKDRKSFLEKIYFHFEKYQTLGSLFNYENEELNKLNLNNQLFLKSLLLKSSKNIIIDLFTLNDANINKEIKQYQILKKKWILNQSTLSLSKNESSELQNTLNDKEAILKKIHSTNFKVEKILKINFKDVASKLAYNEVAVEFSRFMIRKGQDNTNNYQYVAYIYDHKTSVPKVIPLFKEDEVMDILKKSSSINIRYASRGSIASSTSKNVISQELYKFIWKPIASFFKDKTTIYFSADGILHEIPMIALPVKKDTIMGNSFNLVQMNSTGAISENKTEPNLNSSLLFGGIKYDYNQLNNYESDTIFEIESIKRKRSTITNSWGYLKGSLSEVESLEKLLPKAKSLIGYAATESEIKALSGHSPSVLHFATHGYFYKSKKATNTLKGSQLVFEYSKNPLLRSGLILANGNYAWQHGSNPFEKEDGILTALEISNLDLSNTDIVVLSACETGLGDVEESEGVYGLQRAFKMAGVDIIVMSLWAVPGKETAEFMQLFYTNWKQTSKVRLAFRTAQKIMSEKYKNDPEKWAAFVMIE
jgi:CHAT domain-containing protein/tetratricopeptide (TPR) repeat protein